MFQSLALLEGSADVDVELDLELRFSPRSMTGKIVKMIQLPALHTRYDFHVLFYMEHNSTSIEFSDKGFTGRYPVLNPGYSIFTQMGGYVLSCQSHKEYIYTVYKLGYSWLERRTWSPWPTWIPWSTW